MGCECTKPEVQPTHPKRVEPKRRPKTVDEMARDDDVDEFGFYVEEHHLDPAKEAERCEKWRKMLNDWEASKKQKHKKIKERVRKGIPAVLRGRVWGLLTGGEELMRANPNKYTHFVSQKDRVPKELQSIIERDLHRTLPNHKLFREQEAGGQAVLERILTAYAAYDPEVGYVQGMGFIVSIYLVCKMSEELAFWTMVAVFDHRSGPWQLHDMYLPGFPALKRKQFILKGLTHKFLPKLYEHFKAEDVDFSHTASQWFLTLYTYQFPHDPYLLLRILDIFYSEGWKVMFRVALTLFKLEEDTMLAQGMEFIYPHLKNLQNDKDPKDILSTMLSFPLQTKHIEKLGEEYDALLKTGVDPQYL